MSKDLNNTKNNRKVWHGVCLEFPDGTPSRNCCGFRSIEFPWMDDHKFTYVPLFNKSGRYVIISEIKSDGLVVHWKVKNCPIAIVEKIKNLLGFDDAGFDDSSDDDFNEVFDDEGFDDSDDDDSDDDGLGGEWIY